jgi:threonyl-tRNA synthetase
MKLRVRLSYRNESDAYLGDKKLWESAQNQLKSAVIANDLNYFEAEGEAAFYGPKIDFMATDAIGREHQVATVQLDFVQPERFKLEYTAEGGASAQPVMIHCALLGSIERFLSVYIEHTAGKFPVWTAPEQLRIIQVKDADEVAEFARSVAEIAKEQGIRVTIDDSNESVGKKIRSAEVWKVPYSVVIGDKEVAEKKLTPRIRRDIAVEGRDESALEVNQMMASIANEVKARASKSSL